jgi:RNA polymerase sigma-70 factor (ECF subfamily)
MQKYLNLSDIELLTLMNSSNHAAFEVLYQRYWKYIKTIALKMTKNDDAVAKDLVQDTFLSLYEIKKEPGPGFFLKGYLSKIVRNKAINYLRGNKQADEYYNNFAAYEGESARAADAHLLMEEFVALIQHEIDQMPERMRTIFVLSRVVKLSRQEIANLLNIKEETVKNQLHKALARIRSVIKLLLILNLIQLLSQLSKLINFFS